MTIPKTVSPRLTAISPLVILILLATLSTLFLSACEDSPPQAETAVTETKSTLAPILAEQDRPTIAKVNQKPIYQNIFDNQVLMQFGASQFIDPEKSISADQASTDIKLEVLDHLINLELAWQESLRLGYGPTQEEMELALIQASEEYGLMENLENILETYGENMDQFRIQLGRNLALKKFRDTAFLKESLVSEAEAKAYYEAHLDSARHEDLMRAAQITISIPLATGENESSLRERSRTRAEEALAQAKAGIKFEDLITRYTDRGTLTSTNQGQLGWIAKGTIDNNLEEALFSLKPGEISEVVETPFSFHIIKALEFLPAGVMTFEQTKPDILEYLTAEKIDQAFTKRIHELREGAVLEILDPKLSEAWPDYITQLKNNNNDNTAAVEATD